MRVAVNDTELYFDVEGGELAFGAAGVHVQPTLVVLHDGPGFDLGYPRPSLRPLAEVAQLVLVDLRGGGSVGAPRGADMHSRADGR
jgi:proline iminopeptidase